MTSKQSSAPKNEGARVVPVPDIVDALTLLKSDHEEVAEMVGAYAEADEKDKQDIAISICNALTLHAQIEEELFYPAAREVLDDDDAELLNEADVEHSVVKQLIEQIQSLDGSDDHFDAMVTVLGEYVSHHVEEEENELFPKLQDSDLDLDALGQQLAQRKGELSAE